MSKNIALKQLHLIQKASGADIVLFQFFHDTRFGLSHLCTVVVFNVIVSNEMEHSMDCVKEQFAGRIQLMFMCVLYCDFGADVNFCGDYVVL